MRATSPSSTHEHETRVAELVLEVAGARGVLERPEQQGSLGKRFEQRKVARARLVKAREQAVHDARFEPGTDDERGLVSASGKAR